MSEGFEQSMEDLAIKFLEKFFESYIKGMIYENIPFLRFSKGIHGLICAAAQARFSKCFRDISGGTLRGIY